jgi:hypothetical protein
MKGAVLPGNSTVELRDFPIPEPGHGQVLIKTNGLTNTQRGALDALLNQKPDAATSWMAWLRQPPQAPAARNILALIERLRFVRQLGIHPDRQRGIPVSAFERLAADCLRTTVQHVRELALPRRRAMLVAAVIWLETALADATLAMFDKLVGSMSRKAERQTADKSLQSLREVQGYLGRRQEGAGQTNHRARRNRRTGAFPR